MDDTLQAYMDSLHRLTDALERLAASNQRFQHTLSAAETASQRFAASVAAYLRLHGNINKWAD